VREFSELKKFLVFVDLRQANEKTLFYLKSTQQALAQQTFLKNKMTSIHTRPSHSIASVSFESIKQTNDHNAEFWSARALQAVLGYSQWRRFEQAIERAIQSCDTSGNPSSHHFASAGKPITGGKGAVQVLDDYHLSRFACYASDVRYGKFNRITKQFNALA
jgi:hypothetical protein